MIIIMITITVKTIWDK